MGRSELQRGCGERRGALWVVWRNLPEAGKTGRPGSRSGIWWGHGIKRPIVLGKLAGPETGWIGCLVLGRRPLGVKGSKSYTLADSAPPIPGHQAGLLGVVGSARQRTVGTSSSLASRHCLQLQWRLWRPSLSTLKAAWGGGAEGKTHRGKGLSYFCLVEKFLSCVASRPRVGKVEASR